MSQRVGLLNTSGRPALVFSLEKTWVVLSGVTPDYIPTACAIENCLKIIRGGLPATWVGYAGGLRANSLAVPASEASTSCARLRRRLAANPLSERARRFLLTYTR